MGFARIGERQRIERIERIDATLTVGRVDGSGRFYRPRMAYKPLSIRGTVLRNPLKRNRFDVFRGRVKVNL
jgi:hypothetical protein